jgi:hypothetical protein
VTGERGLAQVQRLGRPRQVAELRNGYERAQLIEIHGVPVTPRNDPRLPILLQRSI